MRSSRVALAKGPTALLPMAPGRLIGGKYELVSPLGVGSMGEVWIARHRSLDERVALKLLSRGTGFDGLEDAETATARFQFEARVAARLSRGTKHIVRVTDHGEEGSLAYLVMELLEGQTLEASVLRYGPLPTDRLATIFVQVARALEHAHAEGVVHRDLKPANIFLTRDEDGALLVKLLDFGIARSVRATPAPASFSTAANVILGTPGYMSPEHVRGESSPDRHCDLWALATVAYEALTTELPVAGVHPDELIANMRARRFVPVGERMPTLPRALGAVFDRAFAERVDDRYPRANEFARDFERALREGRTPDVDREAERRRIAMAATTARRRRPSSRGPWVAAAAACLLGLGGLTALLVSRRSSATAGGPVSVPVTSALAPDVASTPLPPVVLGAPPGEDEPLSPRPGASPSAVPREPSAAHATPLSRGADCSVPFEFDAAGTKRWKRACL